MKKLLPLIIFFLLFRNLRSQIVFCPPGAVWHYVYNSFNLDPTPDFVNETVWNAGTTVINGETVTVLKHSKIFWEYNLKNISETYLKQIGDTVFMKSTITNNQWEILFNFAASAGQSWKTPLSFSSVAFTVTVNSVSTSIINDFQLKTMNVTYDQSNPHHSYTASITERVGGSYYLFNFLRGPTSDGDYMMDFLCYQDSTFGVKQFTSKPCDYSNLTGTSKLTNYTSLKIYPNPAQDFIKIDLDFPENTGIIFTDISGREIKKIKLEQSSKISVKELETGIYLITITKGLERIYTTKLIKE